MDLEALNAMLASLGPWGVFAGVVITLLAQWAKRRISPAPLPVAEEVHEVPPARLFDGRVLRFLIEYGPEIRRIIVEYGPALIEALKALGVIKAKEQRVTVEAHKTG